MKYYFWKTAIQYIYILECKDYPKQWISSIHITCVRLYKVCKSLCFPECDNHSSISETAVGHLSTFTYHSDITNVFYSRKGTKLICRMYSRLEIVLFYTVIKRNIAFLVPLYMFYLLSFGKLNINQFTYCWLTISKGALKE